MTIDRIAIIGAGTMGAGIAAIAASAGLSSLLIDRAPEALTRARDRLARHLERQVAKVRMTSQAAAAASAQLVTGTELSAASDADLVIEAVFERLDVKLALLRELEPLVRPDCLIATNTSCLRVSEIAEGLARPDRFFGLHYFSPVEANPLVELVLGDHTQPGIAGEVAHFLKRTERIVLPCRDRNGFAINRFFCPYVNEAVRCLEAGLGSAAQIDTVACTLFGQPFGPFATTNMVGPSVMLHALEHLAPLGSFYQPAAALRDLVTQRATWDIDPDPAELPAPVACQIADRLRGAVYLPLSELLAEDVASLGDVDVGAQHALRFAIPPGRTMMDDPRRADLVALMIGADQR